MALLFLLCKNPDNLFFTGDEHQIINPSGFRWGDIRTAFWKQKPNPPEIFHLTWNHRSAGGIVELSNALLKLKQTLLPESRHVPEQKARWAGEKPYIVDDDTTTTWRRILQSQGRILQCERAEDILNHLNLSEPP